MPDLAVLKMYGRDYYTVDCRSKLKYYWTRASCDCGRLQTADVTREVKFLSNDYTNANSNPKTLTTLALTLADPHDTFDSFCASVFCDFVRNYSCTVDGAVDCQYIVTWKMYCRNNLSPPRSDMTEILSYSV